MSKFPCVAIIGSRQVGKSTLVKKLFPKAPFFDLEQQNDLYRIKEDPDFFLSNQTENIIIDEAQILPELFPALRVAIDKKRESNGRFLITGSSSPELLKKITESLAGRIAIFELTPLSVYESHEIKDSDFPLRVNNKEFKEPTKARLTKKQIEESWFYGGYPDAFLNRDDKKYYSTWMNNYFATYINRDIRSLFPNLQLDSFKRFIELLSGSCGELINHSNFARSLNVSQPTVKKYFEIAEGSFFWRSLKSYEKTIKKRIVKMPKGHLVDSGLTNFLYGFKTQEMLLKSQKLGRSWEAFVTEQILRSFKNQLVDCRSYHYRTHNQGEIDLVIETDYGLLPIEVKRGQKVDPQQIKTLKSFVQEQKCRFGVVINNAEESCWLNKEILQLPFKNL